MISGEDAFVEQDTPAVHVERGRPTVLSMALQIAHWLVGVGNVDHLAAVRARQVNRHGSMIDRTTGDRPESESPDQSGPWPLTRLPPSPTIVR